MKKLFYLMLGTAFAISSLHGVELFKKGERKALLKLQKEIPAFHVKLADARIRAGRIEETMTSIEKMRRTLVNPPREMLAEFDKDFALQQEKYDAVRKEVNDLEKQFRDKNREFEEKLTGETENVRMERESLQASIANMRRRLETGKEEEDAFTTKYLQALSKSDDKQDKQIREMAKEILRMRKEAAEDPDDEISPGEKALLTEKLPVLQQRLNDLTTRLERTKEERRQALGQNLIKKWQKQIKKAIKKVKKSINTLQKQIKEKIKLSSDKERTKKLKELDQRLNTIEQQRITSLTTEVDTKPKQLFEGEAAAAAPLTFEILPTTERSTTQIDAEVYEIEALMRNI